MRRRRQIAYVAANPVTADLVTRPENWPWFIAWKDESFVTARPVAYFREDGTCPAELGLAVAAPILLRDDDPGTVAWSERVAQRVAQRVSRASIRLTERFAKRRAGPSRSA